MSEKTTEPMGPLGSFQNEIYDEEGKRVKPMRKFWIMAENRQHTLYGIIELTLTLIISSQSLPIMKSDERRREGWRDNYEGTKTQITQANGQ